jgi:PAB-dependent poly(A)-specific ribonuclease subunit 2
VKRAGSEMAWHEDGRAYLAPQQCLAFDSHQELLWAGGLSGHVSSYFTNGHSRLHRYTQYRAHVPGPARELLVDDRGIFSIGGSIKLANRRGLALWNVQSVES